MEWLYFWLGLVIGTLAGISFGWNAHVEFEKQLTDKDGHP